MDTEQQKHLHVRINHLRKAIRALDKASTAALSGHDVRASDKLREYRRYAMIELKIAERDREKVDLF